MRIFFFLLPAILSFSIFSHAASDTSAIVHKIDGSLLEWPADKFSTDNPTGIQYAIDNDAQHLYIMMKVADRMEQAKIMQMGMRLFIDLKGKRKKDLGVEFPIQKDNMGSDYEGLRMMLSLNPKIKSFGFSATESLEQDLFIEGNINLAFDWDSTNAMNIEWLVPLKMLEQEILSLDHKLISIGWKINGVDMPVVSATPASNSLGGLPNNGISKPSKPSGRSAPAEADQMMKEQDIWAKYTLVGISN